MSKKVHTLIKIYLIAKQCYILSLLKKMELMDLLEEELPQTFNLLKTVPATESGKVQ